MTLIVAVKGSDGVVLAADSRLSSLSSTGVGTYDTANKLFSFSQHSHAGMAVYGQATLNQFYPRWIHDLIAEFSEENPAAERSTLMSVATAWRSFILPRWREHMGAASASTMGFLIAGFDPGHDFGRLVRLEIPSGNLQFLLEDKDDDCRFGVEYGGDSIFAKQLTDACDPKRAIPYAQLPLQECVSLGIFLVRATEIMYGWLTGERPVGGPVDVATITKHGGYRAIRQKSVEYRDLLQV